MPKRGNISRHRLSFAEDLIENLPIGMMLLNKKGKVLRMNKKQEEASRISREKILGKTFAEAFPKTLEQGLKKPYENLLKRGTPFDITIDRYIPQYYPWQITYRARGASFSSGRHFMLLHEHAEELGQEKRLVEKRTKELQESKNFLESLIDSSPNIVISTDHSGRILIFNKAAETIFGYREKEVMKKKIDFLFTIGQTGLNRKKANIQGEVVCLRKDQTTFPALIRLFDIQNTRGKSIATLYLISDLTEKKEMEERLHLSEKLALYSELMGGIAHQLNNPLIGVVNFSEMLLKEMADGAHGKELAETISRAGKECLRIITSVLNCIKDPNLTFSKTDIHEVLSDSLRALREQFGERLRNISIRTRWHPEISPILGDEIQLKQCILNIMINAIQALPDGGSLNIETQYDEVTKAVKIIFSDTGIGIPREYLNKIFLPFISLRKNEGRHGLGLSFAYQIVKNHGGHIEVESQEGIGSTFTIALPSS
ncbi:MAG: PAS domain S-box protein [Deltaproteobacteria bacterium]|nr:PAS domain S-box protein [Deltaproteobacteria bacterium]